MNFDEKVSVPDQGLDFNLPIVTLARSANDKAKKILEEAQEVFEEMDSETGSIDPERITNFTKETLDTMISCQSTLTHLAYLGVPVQDMIIAVIKKNEDRGYYTPGGIPYQRD